MEEKKSFLKQKIDLESPNKNIVPITTLMVVMGSYQLVDALLKN